MNDKISVIMATYNCADTVEKAIDSILAQSYENWVMIICDDDDAHRQSLNFCHCHSCGGECLPQCIWHCRS